MYTSKLPNQMTGHTRHNCVHRVQLQDIPVLTTLRAVDLLAITLGARYCGAGDLR